jgi:hypothetical protein
MCFKPSMIIIHWVYQTYLSLTSFQMQQNIFFKKDVTLYNTSNIYENATLPLLIPKYVFCWGSFSNYVILIIKHTFRH